MTTKEWFNAQSGLQPGAELFRSGRRFELCAYADSHGQLLFRSHADLDRPGDPANTTIDVLFKPAAVLKIRDFYDGLVIRCATAQEAEGVRTGYRSVRFSRDDRVFVLESKGETDYVVAMAVGWHEGVLPPTRQSFFIDVDAGRPRWPSRPLFSAGPSFNLASVQELVTALSTTEDGPVRRERYRHVYVVMTRVDRRDGADVSGAGVFLTEADAEDARAMIAPEVAACWIETLPIAV
ncbi:hypothetical protein [Kitasatospora sp. NPDC018619]|uniref:hypothetical protein n=1 Tax=unclassified Kitasatospora TaxID=2633591 RepID=UPI0037B71066